MCNIGFLIQHHSVEHWQYGAFLIEALGSFHTKRNWKRKQKKDKRKVKRIRDKFDSHQRKSSLSFSLGMNGPQE